jgi:hypothetical protein
MYSEFASDPKVQSMSEAMQRRLMMLLCLRCSNTLVTLQDDEIAFALRISTEELAETKALFLRKGFVNEAWEIANWDKRQFVSDSSAVRVARHRANKKQEAEQASNVTVTPQIQNRTDTEQNQNREEKAAPQAAARKPSRKTPLPENFCISEAVRSWAASNGVQNLDRHFASFVTKVKANGYTYVDWDAAFRNAITDDWAKLGGKQLRAVVADIDTINARNNAEAKRLLGIDDDLRTING